MKTESLLYPAPAVSRPTERWILTLNCPDRLGIVAGVADALRDGGCNIVESAQFGDGATGRFFMRVCVDASPDQLPGFMRRFREIAASFSIQFDFAAEHHRPRMLVMVSREGHCLHHILSRRMLDELSFDVSLVVSNHENLRGSVEAHGIPFVHVPVTPESRITAEAQLRALIQRHAIEWLALARYMQVLSPEFCADFAGRIVNIHHSFLPSFKGAHPYHQAYELGVKLVGATAHFVTADLDCGPIIEQQTMRVDHATSVTEMIRRGRDVEAGVLTRSLNWLAERRIMLNGRKTVVMR